MVKQPFYHSTRGNEEKAPKEAILQGIAKDGGLFVWDGLDEVKIVLEDFLKLEYKDMVKVLFKELLWDYSEEELQQCANQAYDGRFDDRKDHAACHGGASAGA